MKQAATEEQRRRTPLGFTMRSAGDASQRAAEERGISRLPCKVFPRVRGVRRCLAMAAAPVWPSACLHSLGTPDNPRLAPRGMDYAAQYPARAYPCQRFAHTLTNVHA